MGHHLKRVTEDDDDEDEDQADDDEDDDVDLDVLPTLLVYRDGELVYNWVRVDWEAGRQGVEELLFKYVVTYSLPSHRLPTPLLLTQASSTQRLFRRVWKLRSTLGR